MKCRIYIYMQDPIILATHYWLSNVCRKFAEKPAVDFHEGTTPFNRSYGLYSTHVYTRRAENIIQKYGVDQTTPLFMRLSYQAVHTPIQVPEEYENKFEFIPDRQRRKLAGMVTGEYPHCNVHMCCIFVIQYLSLSHITKCILDLIS